MNAKYCPKCGSPLELRRTRIIVNTQYEKLPIRNGKYDTDNYEPYDSEFVRFGESEYWLTCSKCDYESEVFKIKEV